MRFPFLELGDGKGGREKGDVHNCINFMGCFKFSGIAEQVVDFDRRNSLLRFQGTISHRHVHRGRK